MDGGGKEGHASGVARGNVAPLLEVCESFFHPMMLTNGKHPFWDTAKRCDPGGKALRKTFCMALREIARLSATGFLPGRSCTYRRMPV